MLKIKKLKKRQAGTVYIFAKNTSRNQILNLQVSRIRKFRSYWSQSVKNCLLNLIKKLEYQNSIFNVYLTHSWPTFPFYSLKINPSVVNFTILYAIYISYFIILFCIDFYLATSMVTFSFLYYRNWNKVFELTSDAN